MLDTVRRIRDQELILGQISYRNEMERGREKRGGRESGRDRERERERGEIERERETETNMYIYANVFASYAIQKVLVAL